jgi:serine/threonine protein kinase
VNATYPVLPGLEMSGQVAGYHLEECIGESGVAVVRLARDEHLDRKVAVKILAPQLAGDAAFRTRFLSESRAAAEIGHPHIVPVYEAGDVGGILYAAMRHVGGGNARSLLSRLGPLPVAWAWSVIAQVASALDAAHGHGLIHRDVKPANMLLDAVSGAGGRTPDQAADYRHVYLSDFGMGRDVSPGQIIAGQFGGALNYFAPEQIQGRALDRRADLYSLACAAFELLCGAPPFGQDQGLTVMYAQLYAPPPAATALRPDLPAAVDQVLATALAKDPAGRYASCGQFAEELRTALGLAPGWLDDPARPRSPARARPAPRSRPETAPAPVLAPAQPEPGGQQPPHDQPPDNQPPQDRTPARRGPAGRGPAKHGPAKHGPASPDPARGPGRPHARRPRVRSRVIGLILALVAAGIAAAVTAAVVPARPAQGRPVASSRTAASATPASSAPPSQSPPPSPSSAPSSPSAAQLASSQAAAVNNLLNSSAATRRALQGAVSEVGACTDLSGAVSQIQDAVNQRSTEYSQASGLSASALADGTTVKADLTAALRSSLGADRDYLAWAQLQLTQGCVPDSQSGAYTAAYDADQQANAEKAAFVQVWNPVAARYGIAQQSPSSI